MDPQYNIKTIAFPCIATGAYGFPKEKAADVALSTVRDWLKENKTHIDQVIFCTSTPEDKKYYEQLVKIHFPGFPSI